MKVFELKATNQKSYYGKAKVFERPDGSAILQSYNTEVCGIDKNGNFERFWAGYSQTTMKHVNDFLKLYGIDKGGKKFWNEQPLVRFSWSKFFLK